MRKSPIISSALALIAAVPAHALAQQSDPTARLDTLVITAPVMGEPGTVETDPKAPRLPLPAHDGGAYLKSIPGFTVSRKGGTSGDPELRGLGGSRLNILLNDTEVLGGCSARMDPPTAYVFPESYDRIEIIKGPQSVRYGANMAGVVRFERDLPRFSEPTLEGHASMTVGSFERNDLVADVTSGDQRGYIRLVGTNSTQDDYRDGDGDRVHSEYSRWSTTGTVGWTPDDNTNLEFSYDRSDGEAAYDDRARDGTSFERTGYTFKASRDDLAPWLATVETTLYHNRIDHVMDNYRLRTPVGMPSAMNPERTTLGGRLSAELVPAENAWVTLGVDYQQDTHTYRMGMGMPGAFTVQSMPRNDNAEFRDYGAFVEWEQHLTDSDRITTGLRTDRAEAEVLNQKGFGGAGIGSDTSDTLTSGFVRYTHDAESLPMSLYAGIGHAERAPDFWERNRIFGLDVEQLTQLDTGLTWRGTRWSANASAFYGRFDDYIIIGGPEQARNIEASHFGAEADLTLRLTPAWSTTATAAWVRAENDSDDRPLAQTPPLQATLSLDYDADNRFGGILLRGVAEQDRIDPGYGTIYSLDADNATPGFAVTSVYGGYQLSPLTKVTAGIDNLFDRGYAEHIQQSAAELGATTARINEPGRTFWLQLASTF